MDLDHALAHLTADSELMPIKQAESDLPKNKPGLYAIYTDEPGSFPEPFAGYLRERNNNLIYVGKASGSLYERLFEEDLRHTRPSTFFRALGPILGYLPPKGSLIDKKNQNNYRFSDEDTAAIVEWIDRHLKVRIVVVPADEIPLLEASVIVRLTPLLNTVHNPIALSELAELRSQCRQFALAE
jgi:hypothetical protein